VSGHATLSAVHGRASGIAFDGLQADATLKDGVVRTNKLEVSAWGGRR
jgi:uncharacterized protein YhdP